jgi:UTP--glucose-1-phosphate uridylyltransferase
MKISKIVIPAAGFGTRLLPQTKAMPKEMLPIVDKPVIQYIVEEAVDANIKDIIIVTGWHKRAIEDHFDEPYELLKRLEEWKKEDLFEKVKGISELANFIYIRQKGPYGNAIPVKCAEPVLNKEPFFVSWGDNFVDAKISATKQMLKAFEQYDGQILCGIETHNEEDYSKRAFIKGKQVKDNVWKVERLIEKPGKDNLPSHVAVVSSYILTEKIFPVLDKLKPGKGGEYYLADAIDILARRSNVYAVVIKDGIYFDTGSKLGYAKTFVEYALKHPEIGKVFKYYLKSMTKRLD